MIKKRTDMVPGVSSDVTQSYLEDYVSTHIAILKSPAILDEAIKKGDLGKLKTFQGEGNPVYVINAGLSVSRDASGNRTIIDLTFQGPHPEETGTILNAVIDSYLVFLAKAYRTFSNDTEESVKKVTGLLENELRKKKQEYEDFKAKSPFLVRGKDGLNVHQAIVFEIENKKATLQIRKAELESRLQHVETARKKGEPIALLPLPSDLLAKDTSVRKDPRSLLEEQLILLDLDERDLLQQYGEDHPKVRAVRARMERARVLLGGNKIAEEIQQNNAANKEETVERYLRTVRQELVQIEVSLRAMTDLSRTEVEEAKASYQNQEKENHYLKEIAKTERYVEQLFEQLDKLSLMRDFGGYDARVIASAGPGSRIAAGLFRTLMICVFMGLIGGAGLAYLADATDRSFRTPEEIRRSLGLAILGHIPFLPRSEKMHSANGDGHAEDSCHPALCVYHHPSSLEAEAYRSLRTALYFGTRGEGHRVIQITSPNMGDGKTTLISNLAIAIAQSGKRVIVVDADLRRPRIHSLFGLPSGSSGLTAVLAGETPLVKAIKPTLIPGLDLLPCGTRPSNPAELLTSAEFEQVLSELRRDYDFILVDTPPLLAVTDPCVVAGHVDGVLLTIRVSKNGRPSAERAKELIGNIGVNLLGVVVNGIGRDGNGSGYGYRYYAYDHYGHNYRSDEDEDVVIQAKKSEPSPISSEPPKKTDPDVTKL